MQCNTLPQSALLLALSIILFARIIWPGQRQTSFATKLQSLITKLTWPRHFLCICLAVLMPHIHTSPSRQSYQLFCHCKPFLCSGLYCPLRFNKKVCLLPGQTSWCEHLLCQLNTRFGSLSCLIEDYRKSNDSIDTDLLNWFDFKDDFWATYVVRSDVSTSVHIYIPLKLLALAMWGLIFE